MKNVAIFASGSGTNAENIARYFSKSETVKVAVVLSNNKNVGVHARVNNLGIPSFVFSRDEFVEGTPNLFTRACTPTFRLLDKTSATLIVSLLEKYRAIFSAFVPEPEAKTATFFMFSPIFVHKKRKNVQFSTFLVH